MQNVETETEIERQRAVELAIKITRCNMQQHCLPVDCWFSHGAGTCLVSVLGAQTCHVTHFVIKTRIHHILYSIYSI